MSALDTMLGKPGEPPQCKVFGPDLSVHWYTSPKQGAPCFCGATKRGIDTLGRPVVHPSSAADAPGEGQR